jgi:hypothetical protein
VASPHSDRQAEFSYAIACLAAVAITEHPLRLVVCLARLACDDR